MEYSRSWWGFSQMSFLSKYTLPHVGCRQTGIKDPRVEELTGR